MKYLAIIYAAETNTQPTPEEMQLWFDFNEKNKNYITAGEALMPTKTATSLSNVSGKMIVSDGPFAETKEALGGFYMLDCKDLEEAIEVAKQIPSTKYGTVEVRPIMEIPDSA